MNKRGNEETIVAAQIETKDALANIDEICAVPGLDIAFVGPGDLCTDMGLVRECGMPNCFGDARFALAVETVAAMCKKHGKIAGFWNSEVEDKASKGYRFLVVDGDLHAMQAALTSSLAEKRAAMERAGVL